MSKDPVAQYLAEKRAEELREVELAAAEQRRKNEIRLSEIQDHVSEIRNHIEEAKNAFLNNPDREAFNEAISDFSKRLYPVIVARRSLVNYFSRWNLKGTANPESWALEVFDAPVTDSERGSDANTVALKRARTVEEFYGIGIEGRVGPRTQEDFSRFKTEGGKRFKTDTLFMPAPREARMAQ